MKFKHFIFAAVLLMASPTFAQTVDKTDILSQYVRKSKVPVWLNMNPGLNIADCYDKGTIPFRYLGTGGNISLGATIEWGRCHVQTELRLFGDMMVSLDGYSVDIDSRTEFLYRFHDSKRNRFHLWAGGGLQTYYDVKQIPAMMNASTGFSAFENLCATGMVQYDFAFIHNESRNPRNLLTAYAKLNLPVAGLAMRPGFAYMDNYTGDLNEANTVLSNYVTFSKWFPGVSTDMGLYLNLLNGNRIGLNYRWDYLSTGHKDIYRFDNALHSINISFMFKIN